MDMQTVVKIRRLDTMKQRVRPGVRTPQDEHLYLLRESIEQQRVHDLLIRGTLAEETALWEQIKMKLESTWWGRVFG